jgi:hypothetical protein
MLSLSIASRALPYSAQVEIASLTRPMPHPSPFWIPDFLVKDLRLPVKRDLSETYDVAVRMLSSSNVFNLKNCGALNYPVDSTLLHQRTIALDIFNDPLNTSAQSYCRSISSRCKYTSPYWIKNTQLVELGVEALPMAPSATDSHGIERVNAHATRNPERIHRIAESFLSQPKVLSFSLPFFRSSVTLADAAKLAKLSPQDNLWVDVRCLEMLGVPQMCSDCVELQVNGIRVAVAPQSAIVDAPMLLPLLRYRPQGTNGKPLYMSSFYAAALSSGLLHCPFWVSSSQAGRFGLKPKASGVAFVEVRTADNKSYTYINTANLDGVSDEVLLLLKSGPAQRQ